MQIVKYNNTDKDTLVASIEEFRALKKWIEGTSLFNSIISYSGTPTTIVGIDGSIALEVHNRIITSVDELPIELMIEFYNNWPDKNLYEVTCEEPRQGAILEISHTVLEQLSNEDRQKLLEAFNRAPTTLLNPSEIVDRFAGEIISDQRREDMIVGAMEGGSNYWCWIPMKNGLNIIHRYCSTTPRLPISIGMWRAIQAGETISIHDNEDRRTKIGEINLHKIKLGEKLMLEKQPKHFADIVSENDDAETADVWFQYCVLGDIVYG